MLGKTAKNTNETKPGKGSFFSEKELFSYKTKLIQPWPVVQEKAIATARSCL
ncbi:hypothetical protein PUP66_24025 [Pseudomonas chlororaphis]|uniref:hypothetical protein n=1 Tax=Pseudomonas chlororaphis TaxID=587753 RepID=UPI0013B3A01C|nr:hypothetical protein [Pseudomonas chlororaphis]WDH46126.1 hypothetical protein PUP66_24025 [Pseudomonas chlororaphis]WDH57973.1 hypothetical protein PUP56_24030 [Pseudomonas chlororaphis]WQE17229.1 hypothetical protein U0007_22845 [Pseudomonas chlororaphis]